MLISRAILAYTLVAFDVYILDTTTDLTTLVDSEQAMLTKHARIADRKQRKAWSAIGIKSTAHLSYDYNIRSNISKAATATTATTATTSSNNKLF